MDNPSFSLREKESAEPGKIPGQIWGGKDREIRAKFSVESGEFSVQVYT